MLILDSRYICAAFSIPPDEGIFADRMLRKHWFQMCLSTSEGSIFQVSDKSGFSRSMSETGALSSSWIFGMIFSGHEAVFSHSSVLPFTFSPRYFSFSYLPLSHFLFHIASPFTPLSFCLSLWHFILTNWILVVHQKIFRTTMYNTLRKIPFTNLQKWTI